MRLLDWLSVGGNFAYTDAEYTQPNVTLSGQDITFGDYQDTPRWSGSVFADITLPTPERWGAMTLHTDFYFQTKTYYSSLAFSIDPGTSLPSYSLLNMRYDWKRIFGSNISAAAFVKNLTNDRYFIGGYALGADVGINTHLPGAPQEYGVEFNVTF